MKNQENKKNQSANELMKLHRRIAELEEAENERRQTEKALRESEEKYRAIFENTLNATIIIEANTIISQVNKKFEKLTEYSKDEIEGKKSWREFFAKDEVGKMQSYHDLRRIDPDAAPKNYETRVIDRCGNVRDVCMTIDIIPDTKKSVGSLLEITGWNRTRKKHQRAMEKLREVMEGTIRVMALTVEQRDPYTAGHQRRVADLASAIAKEMNLSEDQIDGIHMAALIHDIGKISIPAEILSNPGQLTEHQFGLIKDHPKLGYDLLKTIDFPWPVAQIVYQHHERMDGSGYPQGLLGKDILLEARILAVADVVEAMASHRPYRPALGITRALEEISRHKNVLYDSGVIDACMNFFRKKAKPPDGITAKPENNKTIYLKNSDFNLNHNETLLYYK